MSQIDHKTEASYLTFVQENIALREDELEEMRQNASTAAGDGKSAHALREIYKNARVPDPDNPYFVRVDLSNGEVRYYGQIKLNQSSASGPIPKSHETLQGLLVLSSRSDGKGYTADYPENLPDLVARTRFTIKQGKLVKISEEFFDGSREEHSVIAADIVTESIEKTRHKKMQPISSTLQPDQFLITREPISHSLAIQGPPGSGKTAVLLERLARISFADEAVSRKGMLLIGPNKPFMEYVSQVLPTLGENDVALKSIDELSDYSSRANSPTVESEELVCAKSSYEMKLLLETLVEKHVKVLPRSTFIKIIDITIEFTPADSYQIINLIEESAYANFSQKRKAAEARVRNLLVERFYEEWQSKRGNLRNLQEDPAQILNQESAFRTIIRNMYPNIDPVSLLSKLKSDASFFMEFVGDLFSTDEILAWITESEMQATKITPSDLPILDYLDHLLNEPGRKWGHIAIDEAQDLTPMQLAMITRRLDRASSLSLAGDLAQATGTHFFESWEGIMQALEKEYEFTAKELSRSYRVPSEILDYAQQFLTASAVQVSASTPFLHRENSLEFVLLTDKKTQIQDAIARAVEHVINKESVLILASKKDREIISSYTFGENENAYVRVMEPSEVKGLEFDVVIVINPAEILLDYPWQKSRRARLLYVLTTRSTKKLVLIGSDLQTLQQPLDGIEEDQDEELVNLNTDDVFDEVIANLNDSVDSIEAETIQSSGETISNHAPDAERLVPEISILDRCHELNVDLRQGSGEYLTGYWIFAGMSQVRCTECGDKPQIFFLKHKVQEKIREKSKHHFALVCQECSVIRDFDTSKHGSLDGIFDELKILNLIKDQCIECGGK